jgi:hypothetical protein
MQNLVGSCLAVAYLSANVYAIVKVRVFELARRRTASGKPLDPHRSAGCVLSATFSGKVPRMRAWFP